ncbi:MAG: hypothetical protein ACLTSK_04260 [Christensenellales bacterium]
MKYVITLNGRTYEVEAETAEPLPIDQYDCVYTSESLNNPFASTVGNGFVALGNGLAREATRSQRLCRYDSQNQRIRRRHGKKALSCLCGS